MSLKKSDPHKPITVDQIRADITKMIERLQQVKKCHSYSEWFYREITAHKSSGIFEISSDLVVTGFHTFGLEHELRACKKSVTVLKVHHFFNPVSFISPTDVNVEDLPNTVAEVIHGVHIPDGEVDIDELISIKQVIKTLVSDSRTDHIGCKRLILNTLALVREGRDQIPISEIEKFASVTPACVGEESNR